MPVCPHKNCSNPKGMVKEVTISEVQDDGTIQHVERWHCPSSGAFVDVPTDESQISGPRADFTAAKPYSTRDTPANMRPAPKKKSEVSV